MPLETPQPPISLAYEQRGSGLPILCLHGHPGSAACMSVFTESLSKHYRTIAPDLRGYGKSQVQAPFQMTDHLQDLDALKTELGITQHLILGWSLGGILAIELALRHPETVAGIILIATAARPVSQLSPPSWSDLCLTGVAGLLNSLKPGWLWNIKTFGRRSLIGTLFSQHTAQAYQYLAAAGTPATLRTSRHAQAALNQAIRQGYNRQPDLHQIHCPCLVLSGADDRHILPQASQATAAHLPNSTWINFPNVAHLFPWEIPQQVQGTILHWLDIQFAQ